MDLMLKIDGQAYSFPVEGQFSWGADETLFDKKNDLLLSTSLADNGYGVFRVLDEADTAAFHAATREILVGILERIGVRTKGFVPERYHEYVTDEEHRAVITHTRDLRFNDFKLDAGRVAELLSERLRIDLDPVVQALGRDHVQLRINRPRSLDINPPHRDAYLSYWRNVLNLWMPICGCDDESSLPVMPGSHLIPEHDVYRTGAGGAAINGASYRVPAIAATRPTMEMVRPNPGAGELIAFTPFLIHGAAANLNHETTRMALEFRLQIKGQVYSNDMNAFEKRLIEA